MSTGSTSSSTVRTGPSSAVGGTSARLSGSDLSSSGLLGTSSARRRYIRSNTSSVTQLLSDSCSSILQRFRRNPSEKLEHQQQKRSQFRGFHELATSASTSSIRSHGSGSGGSTSTSTTSDYGSLGSSTDSVHRSPYLSSLNSTMSTYYKPLFRTFGKRFDSPTTAQSGSTSAHATTAGSTRSKVSGGVAESWTGTRHGVCTGARRPPHQEWEMVQPSWYGTV